MYFIDCDSFINKVSILHSTVNHLSTDLHVNVEIMLINGAQSVTITCTADARPEPSFKIFFNCDMLIKSDKTCRIQEVNCSHVGLNKCVARNILGQRSSVPKCLSLIGKMTYSIQV